MNEQKIRIFDESYGRCFQKEGFLDDFYRRFLNASERVREKFKNTDLTKQKRMLRGSLVMIMYAAENKLEGRVHLERIAHLHKRLAIEPPLYDLWLNCLVEAVHAFDPLFSEQVEDAWRETMNHGIAVMKAYSSTNNVHKHSDPAQE